MGVSLTDLITLAKAGYTPGQVRELMTLDVKAEAGQNAEGQQAAAGATDEPKPASAEPQGGATENGQPADAQNSVDYKALYEKAKADLDAAQKANINKNAGAKEPEDPEKELRAIVGTYL